MNPHIFWILTDGTRNKPGKDKFGRHEAFYEFDKESIRFTKAIASAPSTLLSMSSVLTGRFAAELFPDFKYLNVKGIVYPTYIDVLKEEGYVINSSIYDVGAGRFLFKQLNPCHHVRGNLDTAMKTFEEFNYIMDHNFDKTKPNFVFAHAGSYDDVSEAVTKMMKYIKDKGLYDDSIIIMSSDHGYVDYGRFHYLGWALQPRTHSYYIDSNSYLSNLNIKLPKSLSHIRKKEVDIHVGLFDMFETIFDYLGFDYNCENKKSMSLKPIIEKDDKNTIDKLKKRILRVDNRLSIDDHRKTRILDENESYTISDKLDEMTEIKALPKKFKEFIIGVKKETKKTVLKLIEEEFMKSDLSRMKNKKIAIYNFNHFEFTEFLYEKLKARNKVSVLDLNNIKKDYRKYNAIIAIVNNSQFYGYDRLISFCKRKGINLILLDTLFRGKKYARYRYLKETLNDPAIKKSRYGFLINCGLYLMLLGIRVYETALLDKPINYHPVVKNL